MNANAGSVQTSQPTTMTIHDFPTGPYPTRVRIALAEKNLQSRVRFVTVDLYKGEHKHPEFLANKNYSGTLPVLELEDGTCIAECTAITEYLDALDGAPILTGRTAREKGVIHMMSKRAELELLDPISVHFHHGTPGLGPKVEIYQTPSGERGNATRHCEACGTSMRFCSNNRMWPANRFRWPISRSSAD